MKEFFERGNDLSEFFWPILNFAKNHLITDHELPLWNNLFLSGTPLLPDPQSPLFYPINILSLLLPLNVFFVLSFFVHWALMGIGMYLLGRHGFSFSKKVSLMISLLYMLTPKAAAFLEAGHVGLFYSLTWIPFTLFLTIMILKKPNRKCSIFLALSFSLLFLSHILIFGIVVLCNLIFFITYQVLEKVKERKKSIFLLILGLILTFGLISIVLLPQLSWQKITTRQILLTDHDVYPKWSSKREVLKSVVLPNTDTEKAITLGFATLTLSVYGFLKMDRRKKILLTVSILPFGLLMLNNASPIYSFLINQPWYLLLRVSTRFFIPILITTIILSGYALSKIEGLKTKSFFIGVIFLTVVIELIFIDSKILGKPINKNENMATAPVYEFLSNDDSIFRVYCTNRCLSQKYASIYELQLMDGYSTIQQMNYYKHSWQLTGAYWNYYTLSIPPIGTYLHEQPQLDPKSLGEYNVKYIISMYELKDKNFKLVKKIDNFLIYENLLLLDRAYETSSGKPAKVIIYKPNHIRIDATLAKNRITLSEVYNSDWNAYLNGRQKVEVMETPISLRSVNINQNTKFVDFKYEPESFYKGRNITIATMISMLILFLI